MTGRSAVALVLAALVAPALVSKPALAQAQDDVENPGRGSRAAAAPCRRRQCGATAARPSSRRRRSGRLRKSLRSSSSINLFHPTAAGSNVRLRPRLGAGGVGQEWQPYTDGQWVDTSYGWSFQASVPWGWATYHYGRWGSRNNLGWYWVPGFRWAPAWVAWRHVNGYAAWSPLAPRGFAYGRNWPGWVVVPHAHFTAPIRRWALPSNRVGVIVRAARPVQGFGSTRFVRTSRSSADPWWFQTAGRKTAAIELPALQLRRRRGASATDLLTAQSQQHVVARALHFDEPRLQRLAHLRGAVEAGPGERVRAGDARRDEEA